MDSNLCDLHPDLQPLAQEWLSHYEALGRKAKITITWRTPQEQADIASQGLGLPCGHSKHEYTIDGKPASKAFDFSLYDENGNYISDGSDSWYDDAGQIAKDLGLKWGGDFVHPHPDPDHIELIDVPEQHLTS